MGHGKIREFYSQEATIKSECIDDGQYNNWVITDSAFHWSGAATRICSSTYAIHDVTDR